MDIKTIVFGGGCFWCTEAVFKKVKGVESVLPGYSGGNTKNPTYEQICSGQTGHAEVVQIKYNSKITHLKDLLTIFFGSHDPTTIDRQGNDVGTQYRSVVFTTDKVQMEEVLEFINNINNSSNEGKKVVTEVSLLDVFYEAEDYHKNYFEKNPGNPYCEIVINPKLQKVQEKYAELLSNS